MNLFIDTISSEWNIILFDNNREIKNRIILNLKWNESSKLISNIDELLKSNNLEYQNLDNIVVVNWPGSFTWIRTTVLVVNSINFIIKKNITPISYFDLFKNYPIIKSSSKRDCFLKKDENSKIEVISNEELLNYLNKGHISDVYWEIDKEVFSLVKIFEKIDYENIISEIEFKDFKEITPLYIKKPNIS